MFSMAGWLSYGKTTDKDKGYANNTQNYENSRLPLAIFRDVSMKRQVEGVFTFLCVSSCSSMPGQSFAASRLTLRLFVYLPDIER